MANSYHVSVLQCQVCHQNKPGTRLLPAALVRHKVVELIKAKVPDWADEGYICFSCLNHFRTEYVQRLMEQELGELSGLEQEVAKSLRENEFLAENVNVEFEHTLTFGQRIADKVAEFGGSWRFIIIFTAILMVWIIVNSLMLWWRPFDPYPYILLNLVLSALAAVQAPVIMMSQNRQEARDRLRAESDYKVNLKAEVEIRMINEKLDQLIHHQWTRLLEIQEIQMEMIREMGGKRGS